MNVYEFKYSDGYTQWVFAPDIEEAKIFFLNDNYIDNLSQISIKKVPESEWHNIYPDIKEIQPKKDKIDTFYKYAKINSKTSIITDNQIW